MRVRLARAAVRALLRVARVLRERAAVERLGEEAGVGGRELRGVVPRPLVGVPLVLG